MAEVVWNIALWLVCTVDMMQRTRYPAKLVWNHHSLEAWVEIDYIRYLLVLLQTMAQCKQPRLVHKNDALPD
jgi:hypothetical protein